MLEYEKRYKTLNSAQKQAVDHIDGPMMVIAGPGTGKTELLSMRTANILRSTDMDASNILCLTYTESGVRAMRERLIELIGQDAYRVSIQTFHGFGSEVINTNSDYFYSGADFNPADELSTYEILYKIFKKLPHDNPLSSKLGDDFSYMKKIQTSISDFKRAGLTPDEIQRIARHSLGFLDFAEAKIQNIWPAKVDKKIIPLIAKLIKELNRYELDPTGVPNTAPLGEILIDELIEAADEASGTGKTNTITSWKNKWLEKNADGNFVLKNKKRFEQIQAASAIYQDYLSSMQNAKLYDYDDMILRVVHALEVFHDLRLNLQEKYQYIMVDEFQDTNGAQMRILQSLIETPTGDSPNIMVVGDDDQAIYSFQGAEISNILGFEKLLKDPRVITLRQNYRSVKHILDVSRDVISQGNDRLENQLADINKKLTPQSAGKGNEVSFSEYESQAAEFLAVAENIKNKISAGERPEDIVVLARGKKDILAFLPYLHHQGVKLSFEHDENILESDSVDILYKLSRLILCIARGDVQEIDEKLPEILAHPAFDLSPRDIWQVSIDSYKNRQVWLETMLGSEGKISFIADWLLEMAKISTEVSVEKMLDLLFGSESTENYTSPFKKYFFSDEKLTEDPGKYITHLQSLATIRSNIRQYKPKDSLTLTDFVRYCNLAKDAGISLKNHYGSEVIEGAVQVMTAHKAKGLEFDSVYILHASDDVWGSKSRGASNRLSYPENVAIGQAGDNYDDKLRLFFVAMTRAKKSLHISSSRKNLSGRASLKADFLSEKKWEIVVGSDTTNIQVEAAEHTWQASINTEKDKSLRELLTSQLKNYHLSATHLNSFIDITQGGPRAFLLNNLLHFPKSISASAAMGSSVHKALQKAHQHFRIEGDRRPIEDVVGDFENYLKLARLPEQEYIYQQQKGSDALRIYLEHNYDLFNPEQEVEFDFIHQGSTVETARLTGIVDVMEVDKKNKAIDIVDYKTGKPASSWKGVSDFEKIKLHKYKQQLMFYHLLIENSRDFKGYKIRKLVLDFIEPTKTGKIISLEADFTSQELEEFKTLITKVWNCIISGEFIETTDYEQTYKGILKFEKDLLSKP